MTSTAASTPTRLLTIRPATPTDLPAVEGLLAAAGLPTADVAPLLAAHAADFLVADDPAQPGALLGVAGPEVCGSDAPRPTALLRSVAVRDDWRAHGVGRELVRPPRLPRGRHLRAPRAARRRLARRDHRRTAPSR